MNKKLTILVDMDDVLENFVSCWISEINKTYGTNVKENDITSWEISEFFPSLTKKQLFAPTFEDGFWELLSPLPYSQDIIKQIIQDGHTIRVVTASHYFTIPSKIKKLLSMYPDIGWNDVIIAHDKSLIIGDVLIDDGYHNLEKFNGIKMLFDRPHNQACRATSNGVIRVFDWFDIYNKINLIVREMLH